MTDLVMWSYEPDFYGTQPVRSADGTLIATVVGDSAEADANGALIASAPSMRKALEAYAKDKTCRGDLARITLGLPVEPEGGHVQTDSQLTIQARTQAIKVVRERAAEHLKQAAEFDASDDFMAADADHCRELAKDLFVVASRLEALRDTAK